MAAMGSALSGLPLINTSSPYQGLSDIVPAGDTSSGASPNTGGWFSGIQTALNTALQAFSLYQTSNSGIRTVSPTGTVTQTPAQALAAQQQKNTIIYVLLGLLVVVLLVEVFKHHK